MRVNLLLGVSLFLVVAGCGVLPGSATAEDEPIPSPAAHPADGYAPGATEGTLGVAVFAGGCFWCVESDFEDVEGVVSVLSGYTGGVRTHPTYREVSAKKTEHIEAVRILFQPDVVSYEALVERFWRTIDPFQTDGQFCDRGKPYYSALFVADDTQRGLAEATRAKVAKRFDRTVATQIIPAAIFWPAEDYHQDFYRKNPGHYKKYRKGCGRDRRLKELWGNEAGGP